MEDIPPEVRDIVRRHVTSGDHLEVLMRLHEASGRALSFEELRTLTHIEEASVRGAVADFVAAGLVRELETGDRVQFGPRSVSDRQAVESLAVMYHQRPVTLVRLVYDRPPAPLKSFSDAFRLREPDDK
jgi:hypothetical protein